MCVLEAFNKEIRSKEVRLSLVPENCGWFASGRREIKEGGRIRWIVTEVPGTQHHAEGLPNPLAGTSLTPSLQAWP